MEKFSVCISVYKNDKPDDVRTALLSILNQTVQPNEIVLVVDGKVPADLQQLILNFQQEYSCFSIIWLEENRGLGNALRIATESSKYDLIARMDSDDISVPNRFEQQLKCFEEDKDLSIVGGTIAEFIERPDNIVGKRICPSSNVQIKEYMKSRCALNHVSVMFRKSEVLKAGNYQDWFWNEDYYLWIRMMLNNCKFKNLQEVLVLVRVGKEMYSRRGGWRYFKSEEGIQRFMLKHKIISLPRYIYNTSIRFILQILMPNNIRGIIFRKLARKHE